MKKSFWESLNSAHFLYLGISALIASILCGGFGAYHYFYTNYWGMSGFRIMLLISFFAISFSFFCFRKYGTFSPEKTADIDLSDKPYVLYLRSFDDDSETGKPINAFGSLQIYTEEEILVNSLEQLGMAIAIGRPGEQAPPLGAKRIYVSDEQWQDKVQELSPAARLVIFRLGETEGLKWEWNHCLDTIEDISKLLLVVPESVTSNQESVDKLVENIKRQRNDVVCEKLEIFKPLNIGSIGQVLYFERNEDGTFSVKQTHQVGLGKQLFSDFSYFWKAFRNIRPEPREFYLSFCYNNSTIPMKMALEPIFKRFNMSPYNEQWASVMFRIIQALEYVFALCVALAAVLIICGLLGMQL